MLFNNVWFFKRHLNKILHSFYVYDHHVWFYGSMIYPILLGVRGAKMTYLSGFFKYLQNYKLNRLETSKVCFSNCFKAVLIKLMKIGVRKALNHALSWMTLYRKKSPKILFRFFQQVFTFCHFHVVFASKNHHFWKQVCLNVCQVSNKICYLKYPRKDMGKEKKYPGAPARK